ncbi:MAG: AsmA family protein [Acidobacteriia bacterium]|nr:AsmA family protein [Terriglobia bacterium]
MRRPARIAVASVATVAALYVAAGLTVPWLVDADRFRPRVEARLTEALGHKVSLARMRLSLWAGLALVAEGLEVKGSQAAETGSGVSFAASRVSVRPAILSLLLGDVRLRSVSLLEGAILAGEKVLASGLSANVRLGRTEGGSPRLVGDARGSLRAAPGAPEFRAAFDATVLPDRLRLASLHAESGASRVAASGDVDGFATGRLRLFLRGTAEIGRTRVEGTLAGEGLAGDRPELEFHLTSPLVDFDEMARLSGIRRGETGAAAVLSALFPTSFAAEPVPRRGFLFRAACRGTIEAAKGRLAGLEMTDLRARLDIESEAARFEDATFALYGGRCHGTLVLDLGSPGAPFRLDARLEGVDADRLLTSIDPSRKGSIHGVGSFTLDVGGDAAGGSVAGSIRGSARAELKDGRLPTVGILKQVAQILELAGGRGIGRDETPFDHVSASFDVHEGRGDTKDLEFRSADLDLDGRGSVGFDGALGLDVIASFSRRASGDLVRETPQLKFRLDPGGRLTMPLKIRGDFKAPSVQLDLDRVLREGLERSAGDRGRKGFLKRLLGGN